MTARVLHVSDLHVGRYDAPESYAALGELAARLEPDLLLATGDLAHRGRWSQLERAAEILRGLDVPLLAVPGNHDLPYTVPSRFTRPFAAWTSVFGSTEPVHESPVLVVAGLNSARPWRQQGGAVSDDALERAAALVGTAPEGALRVVALHHHIAAPPWRAARKRPLSNRGYVLRSLAAAGVELIVGGHVHQATIAELREFRAEEGDRIRPLVLATAAGFGRPRPRRSREAQGVNVYESDGGMLTVTTMSWDGSRFSEVGRRSFRRG